MPSALARLKASRLSSITASWSSQPLAAAADASVFARHLVGKGGHLELVFDAAQHVQVGHAGLDHHHVRAFGNVQATSRRASRRCWPGPSGNVFLSALPRAPRVPRSRGTGRRRRWRTWRCQAMMRVWMGDALQRIADGGNAPSIMSLGATMSTPAWACVSAWAEEHPTVSSLMM